MRGPAIKDKREKLKINALIIAVIGAFVYKLFKLAGVI